MLTSFALPLILPAVFGVILSLGFSVILLRKKPGLGWAWALVTSLLTALWCGAQYFWIIADTTAAAISANQVQYVATSLLPLAWLQLSIKETGKHHLLIHLTPLLLVIPAVTLYLAFSFNPEIGNALWMTIDKSPTKILPTVEYNTWFWLSAAYCYLLVGMGSLFFYAHFSQSPHYQTQMFVTCVFPLTVTLLNYLHITGSWFHPLDPTPVGFCMGFIAWSWVTYKSKLFNLSLIARTEAVDRIADAILIFDSNSQLIDYNKAACKIFDLDHDSLGMKVENIIPDIPKREECNQPQVITLDNGNFLEMRTTLINPSAPTSSERIITLRDISLQHETYQMLLSARQELEDINEELNRQANTDELTGLANRRFLLSRLDEEISRARRLDQSLGILFIDLDHFKVINDTYGHSAGDLVLCMVGEALMNHRKGIDIAARYGGEEMVLILTNSNIKGILLVAQRVWHAISDLDIAITDKESITLTASIGVALLDKQDISAYDLIARADEAMYTAKHLGRNRICVATHHGIKTLMEDKPRHTPIVEPPIVDNVTTNTSTEIAEIEQAKTVSISANRDQKPQ